MISPKTLFEIQPMSGTGDTELKARYIYRNPDSSFSEKFTVKVPGTSDESNLIKLLTLTVPSKALYRSIYPLQLLVEANGTVKDKIDIDTNQLIFEPDSKGSCLRFHIGMTEETYNEIKSISPIAVTVTLPVNGPLSNEFTNIHPTLEKIESTHSLVFKIVSDNLTSDNYPNKYSSINLTINADGIVFKPNPLKDDRILKLYFGSPTPDMGNYTIVNYLQDGSNLKLTKYSSEVTNELKQVTTVQTNSEFVVE